MLISNWRSRLNGSVSRMHRKFCSFKTKPLYLDSSYWLPEVNKWTQFTSWSDAAGLFPIRRQWSTHSNHFLIRTVVIWAVTWGNTSWQHQLGNQQSHIHWQGLWCCLLLLHLPHRTQRCIRHLKLIFVVTWRSPAHCAGFECHLFNHGNRLCFLFFLLKIGDYSPRLP